MRGTENQNAVGNLVLHLNGNVRQWILSGVGGSPDTRIRDEEFSARGGMEPAALGRLLRGSVDEALAIIRSLPTNGWRNRTTIQGHDVTLLEAIFHVVEHFSGPHLADYFRHQDAHRRRPRVLFVLIEAAHGKTA